MPSGPPGAIAVVQSGDEPEVFVAGVAEIGAPAAPTVDDHMRVASIAKAFSAATALALVDKGALSLDDTIGGRLPDLPSAWADVTLRALLDHTSGVPDFIRAPTFRDTVDTSREQAPPPERLVAFVEDQPLNFPPGSQYAYSNSDNIAVGLMIESATGRPYPDVLAEQVLAPLGLSETSLPEGVELPEPFIHGYAIEDGGAPEDVSNALAAGWAWASGGVVSTPGELNDFVRGYVSGALYEHPDTRAVQQGLFIPGGGSEPPGPGFNSASLGLFRYETPYGTVYGHSGNTFGYTQLAASSLDGTRSMTMSISLQRTHTSSGHDRRVFDALLRAEQAAICLALDD